MSRLRDLISIVETLPEESLPLLPHLNAQLDNMLIKLKATKTPTTIKPFSHQDKVPPNKKNEIQPRFKPTTKKPGRHTKGSTLRYTPHRFDQLIY